MQLRLSISREGEATVVHVDGQLAAAAVGNLDRTLAGRLAPVILDVTHLLSADEAGVAALRLLVAQGVELRGVSPYLGLLLQRDLPRPPRR